MMAQPVALVPSDRMISLLLFGALTHKAKCWLSMVRVSAMSAREGEVMDVSQSCTKRCIINSGVNWNRSETEGTRVCTEEDAHSVVRR
jgi:hypothetical protein